MTGRGERVRHNGAHPQPQTCPQTKIRRAVSRDCFCIGHRARITSAPQHATRTPPRAPALAATAAPPSRSRSTSARAPRPDLRALRLGVRILRAHALPAALVRREPQLRPQLVRQLLRLLHTARARGDLRPPAAARRPPRLAPQTPPRAPHAPRPAAAAARASRSVSAQPAPAPPPARPRAALGRGGGGARSGGARSRAPARPPARSRTPPHATCACAGRLLL
mmetsp:Transcript_36600/g.96235  ORF Transcript_36600/g.96235 Transcript_36600/m.96235 type:complete len:223 (-) Transcript_36600:177-845(-)